MQRIVVGVDGSSGSVNALAWALRLAGETGSRVEAVHVWSLSYAWIDGGYWPDLERWADEARQAADGRLIQAIVAAGGQTSQVDIIRSVVEGQPARALIDLAKGADLLVLGTRGRGGFTGLLLGSVSQQCVHHATVPVVVVPPPD